MKQILVLILALCLCITPITVSANTLVSKELVSSEYGPLGNLFGIGDRLYKLTYNDNTIDYQLARTTFLKPAFISGMQSNYNVNPGQIVTISFTISGVSANMDGRTSHMHDIVITRESDGVVMVSDTKEVSSVGSITASYSWTIPSTPGVYSYKLQEYVNLWSGGTCCTRARVDAVYFTITTGTPQPTQTTPAPTTPVPTHTPVPTTPSGNCADGTTNLACSTQKPLYCYYGTLINKASACGCPTGQTPSGDSCIAVTPAPTTPAPTTPTPTQTTPAGTTTGTPSQCLTGYIIDPSTGECVKNQQGLPGFEAIFAIIGLAIVAYIILRKK